MKLYERWNAWMHARGSGRMVERDGSPYLERRYLLAIGWFRAFLHTFWRSDPDPLHDHPWPFGRLILWGRYREHYLDGTWHDFGPGAILLWRDARTLHRVELLTPSVTTIFWHGKRCRWWGFLHPDGVWREAPDARENGRPTHGIIFPRRAPFKPRVLPTTDQIQEARRIFSWPGLASLAPPGEPACNVCRTAGVPCGADDCISKPYTGPSANGATPWGID